jgi:hypothetical protein
MNKRLVVTCFGLGFRNAGISGKTKMNVRRGRQTGRCRRNDERCVCVCVCVCVCYVDRQTPPTFSLICSISLSTFQLCFKIAPLICLPVMQHANYLYV